MGTSSMAEEPIGSREFNNAMETLRGGQTRLESSIESLRTDIASLYTLHRNCMITQRDKAFLEGQEASTIAAITKRVADIEESQREHVRHKRSLVVAVIGAVAASCLAFGHSVFAAYFSRR